MRQSGSSAARSPGSSVESSGIESKGTTGWIATPRLYAVRMNQRLVYVVGSVVAAALVVFAVWHARQPKPAPAARHAATTSTAAMEDPNAAAPRIDPEQLLAHFKAGDVTIVDVRDADAFLAAHIPGALHVPLARIDGEVSYLPKGKPVVTYCT